MACAEKKRRERGTPPAPPIRPPFEVLKAGEDALALALWQSLRNVLIWAQADEGERATLFRPLRGSARERYAAAARLAPQLAGPLAVFEALQEWPAQADGATVASACNVVRGWAEQRGALEVASHFAEGAAWAEPGFPRWPVLAGFVARSIGGHEMLVRSQAWYARALVVAVRENDRRHIVLAMTGTAAVLKEQGRYDESRALYERAARRAVRTGRKRQAAQVEHYLCSLCLATGDLDEAVRHASAALSLYPLHDERLPYLAHDLAYGLLRLRHYRYALRLLDGASARIDRPHELALVFASLARAAAGAGRSERYVSAERASLELIRSHPEYAGSAFVNLAEAARLVGDWKRAAEVAGDAERIASERGDAEVARLARELLAAVERREPPPPSEHLAPEAPAAALTRRLTARLRNWRRRGRGIRRNRQGVGQDGPV